MIVIPLPKDNEVKPIRPVSTPMICIFEVNGILPVEGIASKEHEGISYSQILLQPSPLALPPSSHCSPESREPSPHRWKPSRGTEHDAVIFQLSTL